MIRSNSCNFNFFYGPGKRAGFLIILTWMLFFVFPATTVFAHRVVVFAWIEGNMVYTESKFPGGARVSNGKITVYDESGQILLAGNTDDQGKFSFPLPAFKTPSELKIVLNAGMGHQGYWILKKEEVGRALGVEKDKGESAVAAQSDVADQPAASTKQLITVQGNNTPCRLDEAELKRVVEAVVDRKLSPVMDMLISIREKQDIGLDDVVAGLGYIFGLTGLLAWFYSRKKDK